MRIVRHRLIGNELDHELLWSSMGLMLLLLIGLWARFMPVPDLGCMFKTITGYPCVSCGFTRSALALAAGDMWLAVRMNPLLVLIAVAWLMYIPYGFAAFFMPNIVPRWRLQLDKPGDLNKIRWVVGLTLAAIWAWLIIDGR